MEIPDVIQILNARVESILLLQQIFIDEPDLEKIVVKEFSEEDDGEVGFFLIKANYHYKDGTKVKYRTNALSSDGSVGKLDKLEGILYDFYRDSCNSDTAKHTIDRSILNYKLNLFTYEP